MWVVEQGSWEQMFISLVFQVGNKNNFLCLDVGFELVEKGWTPPH